MVGGSGLAELSKLIGERLCALRAAHNHQYRVVAGDRADDVLQTSIPVNSSPISLPRRAEDIGAATPSCGTTYRE